MLTLALLRISENKNQSAEALRIPCLTEFEVVIRVERVRRHSQKSCVGVGPRVRKSEQIIKMKTD